MAKREMEYLIALVEDYRDQMMVDDRMEGVTMSFEGSLLERDLARPQPQVLSLIPHHRVGVFFHGA